MTCEIENTLSEVKILVARKTIAKQERLSQSEYIAILDKLKIKYITLASLYRDVSEDLAACRVLIDSANIISDIYEIRPIGIEDHEPLALIDRILDAVNDCYDLNLCRDAFVAIGKLYYYLSDYTLAENYIRNAFEDYDYSIPTFQLFMKILDKQEKYEEMISLMKTYLNMDPGYHDTCSLKDFHVPNILSSPFASEYKAIFS